MDQLIDPAGWLGAALLLLAYFLVSTKKTSGASIKYQSLNVVGSVLVGANALYYGALPSFSINVIWLGIALFALSRRSFGPEER